MNVKQILFSMIRSEIFDKEPQNDINAYLSQETISHLLSLASKHDLSCVMISAMDKLGVFGNDDESKKLRKKMMVSAYRDGQKEYALTDISKILEKNRISYLPLKGAIVRDFYPKTWMRTSCDIDILVYKNDADKAISELCKNGFIRNGDQTKHDYSLTSPSGVHLELHYVLTSQGIFPKADEILERVWDYTRKVGQSFKYTMTSEMFLFYHVVHMAKHFVGGGCGIRPFIDLHLLFKKMPYNTNAFETLLIEAELKDFYDSVKTICNVWFEEEAHNDLTKQIEQYVLTGGVYGSTDNSAMVKAASGEGKIKSLFRIMILPFSDLSVLYPKLKIFPVLYPYYQVKRWLRIFDKDKRHRITRLANARTSVTQDEADFALVFLKKLGLIK